MKIVMVLLIGLKYSVGHEESLKPFKNKSDLSTYHCKRITLATVGWMDGWRGKSVASQGCSDTTEGTTAIARGELMMSERSSR